MRLKMTSKTPLADGIRNVLKGNQKRNYYVIITGKTQTRKSTFALRLAMDVSGKRFKLHDHVAIIDPEAMIDALKFEGLKRGDTIVLDEFGVGMDHRRWQSFFNRAMNYIMMTHGFKGICVIVTVPYRDYVDSDVLKLFDMQIETLRKHEKKRYVIVSPKLVQYNQNNKKTYMKYTRTVDSDGIVYVVDQIRAGFPPEEIMQQYFQLGNSTKEDMGHSLKREARKLKRKEFLLDEYVKKSLPMISDLVIRHGSKKIVSAKLVENKFDIPYNRAMQIKAHLEKNNSTEVENAKV